MFDIFGGKRGDEEVTVEELLEIHEFKVDKDQTKQVERDLEALKNQIHKTQQFLHIFLRSDAYFKKNVNLALREPSHNLSPHY